MSNRLSVIRTGYGDSGHTRAVGGVRIPKVDSRLSAGNDLQLARNHLLLVQNLLPHRNQPFDKFIKDTSWKIGMCLNALEDLSFPHYYQEEILNFIDNLAHMTYPDFVTSDSNLWAYLEIATTYVRQVELHCWKLQLPRCAKFLNIFADYCFMINLINNSDTLEVITPITDCDKGNLDTSE